MEQKSLDLREKVIRRKEKRQKKAWIGTTSCKMKTNKLTFNVVLGAANSEESNMPEGEIDLNKVVSPFKRHDGTL